MTATEAMPSFLIDPAVRLLLFGGKGGVGKSTCATAAALEIATRRPDEVHLLLSTDPAHSLQDALAGLDLPPGLEVLELDTAASLRAFKARHEGVLREIAERGTFLDEEDIRGLMDLSAPGQDELVAYLDMAQWLEEGRYDCLVVDTAPTGHTLRLLEMPALLRRWLEALDALLAKHRYMRQRFAQDQGLDHLDRFLLELQGSLKAATDLLRDEARCRFVPILLAETMSIEETADLVGALAEQRVPAAEMVVNRVVPENDCATCRAERHRQLRTLAAAQRRLPATHRWALPLLAEEPRGCALRRLWHYTRPLGEVEPPAGPVPPLPVHVLAPAPLPEATLRLLLFAGKGGVGKTTLSCATALRLHAERPGVRLLLLSTDPAHSLSDCLGTAIGDTPTPVQPGLDAQEMDAEAAFAEVRAIYREDLAAFLGETLPNLDLTFDREVMERLLDLAPPGLDEIMALTTVMAHLGGDRYDLVVLDTAPSGHLIRLLETPQLIDQWLKRFFDLLLKYRNALRLPRLSERLVGLSRDLKALRSRLSDPGATALYGVTLPTALALEETADLLQALERLGIAAPCLFVNQMTPTGDCDLCTAVHRREAAQLARARSLFVARHQVRVYRQEEPQGLVALTALGGALYAEAES